jgi:diguanylate cyclase (GGDEF)-like protein
MDKLYKTYRLRLIIISLAILVALKVTLHITVYLAAKDTIEGLIGKGAEGTAVSIAQTIMLQSEEYKSLIETKDANSDYYKKAQAFLAEIKKSSNAKYIYSVRKIDDKTLEYLLDAEPVGSEGYTPPGELELENPAAFEVYATGQATPYKLGEFGRWGKLLGACAPIYDSDGEMLGVVGVDVDSAYLYSRLNGLSTVLFAVYFAIFGLSFAFLLKYSATILEPLLKDKLTGAYSKRYFESFLKKEIAHAIKDRAFLALLMLDLDHFKKVNDTDGHVFGDKVLAAVSEIVKKSLRPTDYFIRYGGEEFVVMMANNSTKHVIEVAERIRVAVESAVICNDEMGKAVPITVSIGVANTADCICSAGELIEHADKALYEAKTTRNAVSLYGTAGRRSICGSVHAGSHDKT